MEPGPVEQLEKHNAAIMTQDGFLILMMHLRAESSADSEGKKRYLKLDAPDTVRGRF